MPKWTYVLVFGFMTVLTCFWIFLVIIGYILWLPVGVKGSLVVFGMMFGVFALMIAGWIVEHIYGTFILSIYTWMTYVMFGVFYYAIFFSLGLALAYIPLRLLGLTGFIKLWGPTIVVCSILVIIGIIGVGMINARRFRVTKLKIRSPRLVKKRTRMVMVSDIHVSGAFAKCQVDEIQEFVDRYEPDILLAVGDLIEMHPKFLEHARERLTKLFSGQPTYAVTGNHEYINNPTDTVKFLEDCGAHFIRDTTYRDPQSGIIFAGLEDPSGNHYFGKRRDAMERILSGLDGKEAVVVLEHQPQHFDAAADHGVELMLSGHTHAGQLWPFGYAVKKTFGETWRGRTDRGNSVSYTGDGSGTWGPPMRIGSVNEIVVIDMIRTAKGS